MPYQQYPVDDRAVLPEARQQQLNDLRPGSGDELLASNKRKRAQAEDPTNYTHISAPAFAATSIASTVAARNMRNPVGKALVGSLGSATAGGITGTAIAWGKASVKAKIPTQASMDNLEANLRERARESNTLDRPPGMSLGATEEQIAGLDTYDVNLNYARKMSSEDRIAKNQKAADARPNTLAGMAESFGNKVIGYGGELMPANGIQGGGVVLATMADAELPDYPWAGTALSAGSNGAGIGASIPGLAALPATLRTKDAAIREAENDRAREAENDRDGDNAV
jgi:hypothetical protein